jgi:hypothetical protein
LAFTSATCIPETFECGGPSRPRHSVLVFNARTNHPLLDFDGAVGLGFELVDLVGVLVEEGDVVVADHQDLEAERAGGVVNHFDEARNELRPEPAVLFIENEKAAVPLRIESRKGEHPQAHAQDVGNGAPLAAHDVFFLAIAKDGKLDGRGAALEIGRGSELDRLLEDLLEGDCQLFLHNVERLLKQLIAERFERGGDVVGDAEIVVERLELCVQVN